MRAAWFSAAILASLQECPDVCGPIPECASLRAHTNGTTDRKLTPPTPHSRDCSTARVGGERSFTSGCNFRRVQTLLFRVADSCTAGRIPLVRQMGHEQARASRCP